MKNNYPSCKMLLRTKMTSKHFHGSHINTIHTHKCTLSLPNKIQTTQFLMEPTDLHSHFPSPFHVSQYLNLFFIFLWKPFSLLTLSLLFSILNLPLPRIFPSIPPNPDQILFLYQNPFHFLSKHLLLPSLSDHLSLFLRLGSPISNMGWRL